MGKGPMNIANKPSAAEHPTLKGDWDAYGHAIAWDDLFDCKFGRHGFVALAWMEGDLVNFATMSLGYGPDREHLRMPGEEMHWGMQDDGHDPVRLSTWRKARVVRDCDHLDIDWEAEDEWNASQEG